MRSVAHAPHFPGPSCYGDQILTYGKILAPGGMAERLKAHVLKTCLGHTNVGSNPTPSATRSKDLR